MIDLEKALKPGSVGLGFHRGKPIELIYDLDYDNDIYIDDVDVVVIKIKDENGWLVVANLMEDEDRFEDVHFDTLEEAVVYLRLMRT